jgi:hypothetical protein
MTAKQYVLSKYPDAEATERSGVSLHKRFMIYRIDGGWLAYGSTESQAWLNAKKNIQSKETHD